MLKQPFEHSVKRTSLYSEHKALGALMVNFAGYEMPLHYGSQIEEHHKVRQDAGIFDVSHMGIIDIQGEESAIFLKYILANNVEKLKIPGKALYTCMLNPEGGIKDDLIVYFLSDNEYRLVVNAGTKDKDLQWLIEQGKLYPSLNIDQRSNLSMLAVQGPHARQKLQLAFPVLEAQILTLKPFHFFQYLDLERDYFVARTGYTGEDGFEIILPSNQAEKFWKSCLNEGIAPIGLGARDTLRLEAGYNLYGQDMDESVTPLESNLEWTVSFEPKNRPFIGRIALENQKKLGVSQKLVGLVLEEKGVLRRHDSVFMEDKIVGEITSGTFSPTLKKGIGLARVERKVQKNGWVNIRKKRCLVDIVQTPFIKRS